MKKILILLVAIMDLILIGCGESNQNIETASVTETESVTEMETESVTETAELLTAEQISYYEEFAPIMDEALSRIASESDKTFVMRNIYLKKSLDDRFNEYTILFNGIITLTSPGEAYQTGVIEYASVSYGYSTIFAASSFESNTRALDNEMKIAKEIINGGYSQATENDVFETYAPDIIHWTRLGEDGCDIYYGRMVDSEMEKIQEKYSTKFN